MEVVTAHPIVDAVLDRHGGALGDYRPAYANHVYRCLTYHQLLLGFSVPDTAALAWATHDLGIWTADTWDYLGPSADLAEAYAGEYGITDVDQLRGLVTEHHRLRPVEDRVTETFRRADLIDVSRGVLTQGVGRAAVRAVVQALPYNGFHTFLAKGLAGHAVRHPLRPMPMLRFKDRETEARVANRADSPPWLQVRGQPARATSRCRTANCCSRSPSSLASSVVMPAAR